MKLPLRTLTALVMLALPLALFGQNERKMIRQGVKAYEQGEFGNAEVEFRKAAEAEALSFEADFNTGTALHSQEKYEESLEHYQDLLARAKAGGEMEVEKKDLGHIWHNMGNNLLEAEKYPESIEAYKNSLRLNPGDLDSKHNLAYAQKKLQEQQNQDQQNQDQQNQDQQNQDQQNQDQQNQDQQNQDQQNQDQQNQDQQNQEQQNQDQQNQDQQNQDQQQGEQQAQPLTISKEDAERMLTAIQEKEKEVKEKVDKKKALAKKTKSEKDW